MEAKAIAKYVRMSPSKIKPVVDLVRGKDLNEALTILKFTPGKGAEIVEKVVQSAAANADVKEMNADNLYVAEIFAHQHRCADAYARYAEDDDSHHRIRRADRWRCSLPCPRSRRKLSPQPSLHPWRSWPASGRPPPGLRRFPCP